MVADALDGPDAPAAGPSDTDPSDTDPSDTVGVR
jgi:hypothetical protein